MEPHRPLDAAGRAADPPLIALLLLLFFLASARAQAPAQAQPMAQVSLHSSAPNQDRAAKLKKLYDAGRWREVVRETAAATNESAAALLYRGLALAQLGRLREARRTFEKGLADHPRDTHFLTELAGIDYREKRYSAAKRELRRALAIDPQNGYANDFLATIYSLDGNLEAALKYWNRVRKPKLNDLTYHVSPGLDRVLLDRAFEFSRGSEWSREQFLTTRARLAAMNLFPQMRFDLEAEPDGSFDLGYFATERTGLRRRSWLGVVSMLRGLPYQSVYPEFYNLNGKGLNWLSFFRWDDEKRRLSSEISGPLFENPKQRFRVYLDGRNENWDISRTMLPGTLVPAGMNMERAVAGAEFRSIESGRWQWHVGAEYTYRRFRSLTGIPPEAMPFFTDTSSLALRFGAQRWLIRYPERRFTLDSTGSAEIGNFYTNPLGRYSRIEGSLNANWLPKARGEDYRTQTRLRAGRTFGQVPFDDLFTLGFDRDNALWMRGHDGLRDGKKGNAPLGRNFILSNSEIDKIVYSDGLFTVKLGPFLDTGDIYDPSGFFGSPKWLTDTGVQATVKVLGSFQVVLGYGKDLRSGNNTFYTTVFR